MVGHTRALATIDRSDVVAVEISEDLPLVLGDPGLLERAVANVVDNALRHAHGAAVEVRGSAHAGRVELRVCDHGPGLPRGRRRDRVRALSAATRSASRP